MNTDIFRLAVVLYVDKNYKIESSTVHKKIIESFFVDSNNKQVTVYTLINEIKNKYDFLDKKEIHEIVANDPDFNISVHKDELSNINLVQSKYLSLKNKIQKNNIDTFLSGCHETISELQKIRNEKIKDKLSMREETVVEQKLIDEKVKNDFIKYQMGGYFYIVLAIFCSFFVALNFFYKESSWNYINYVESLSKGFAEKELIKYIFLLPLGFFVFCAVQIYKRLICIKAKKKKKEIFRQKYNDKIICKFYSNL